VELKLLIKRGALIAAVNWQAVVIQFVAKTTFHALLAVPLVGAALLVTVLLGADVAQLLEGSIQEIFRGIINALTAQPLALSAFIISFAIVVLGGSVLMSLIKGGTVEVLLATEAAAGPIESEPLDWNAVRATARFTIGRFASGCRRLFRRYLTLGLLLILVYGLSAGSFLAFTFLGYQTGADRVWLIGWTFITAFSTVGLVIWITIVNLLYLLMQIAIAAADVGIVEASRMVASLVRGSFRQLGALFLAMFVVITAATVASWLAWSGVGLIAFIPLIGLAVIPLLLAAFFLRGLAFEYIGLTALAAYATLHGRHAEAVRPLIVARASSASHPAISDSATRSWQSARMPPPSE
jgi:hypothetical protein